MGAVTLLESCDGKVLLTRRASHLSIFPGVWVPPGGCYCCVHACMQVNVQLIQILSTIVQTFCPSSLGMMLTSTLVLQTICCRVIFSVFG